MGVNNWVKRERKANSFVQCHLLCFTEKYKFSFSLPIIIPTSIFKSQSNESEKLMLHFIAGELMCLIRSFSDHKPLNVAGSWNFCF